MNTQPINTPDPGRPINVGSEGRARTDQPAELDPGMGAMLDKAAEALWHLRSDKGRYDIAPEVAMARTALSAAGVPGLVAEVERWKGEADDAARDAITQQARATSAEQERDEFERRYSTVLRNLNAAQQERDRLRARIEVLAAEFDKPSPSTLAYRAEVARALRALLAGSGEQPAPTALVRVEWGVVLDDLGSTDVYDTREEAEARADGGEVVRVETWRVGSGEQPGACGHDFNALVDVDEECHAVCSECEPSLSDRPAPVAPDSADVRAVTIAALDAVQPTWRATGREPSEDDLAWTRAVLAVVGQGVTAEAKADGWDEAAEWVADPHVRRGVRQANPYRAAVRPTGQEGSK